MGDHGQDDDTTATTTNPLLESLRAYVDARVDARLAEHGLGDSDSDSDSDSGDGNEDDSDSDDEQPSAWGVGPYGDGPYGED